MGVIDNGPDPDELSVRFEAKGQEVTIDNGAEQLDRRWRHRDHVDGGRQLLRGRPQWL